MLPSAEKFSPLFNAFCYPRRMYIINSQSQIRSDRHSCLLACLNCWSFLQLPEGWAEQLFKSCLWPSTSQSKAEVVEQSVLTSVRAKALVIEVAWELQDAWACSQESQLSWNLAENSVKGVVYVSGGEKMQLGQEAQKNVNRPDQAGQSWVMWNSFSSAAIVFTDHCQPNCWNSVLVNLVVFFVGVKPWAGARSQPARRLHPVLGPPNKLGKHRSGGILWLLCAACVFLPLTSYPPCQEAGAAGPSWFCVIIFRLLETQVDVFCCTNWREVMKPESSSCGEQIGSRRPRGGS